MSERAGVINRVRVSEVCIQCVEGFDAPTQLVGLEERWVGFESRDDIVRIGRHYSSQLAVIVSHSCAKSAHETVANVDELASTYRRFPIN